MNYVLYASTAVTLLSDEELRDLLVTFRAANLEHGISGLLMYHDGNWIQYIEGDAVEQLFKNIRADISHKGLITLDSGVVSDRVFPDWSMGYKPGNSEDYHSVTAFFELNKAEVDRRMAREMPRSVHILMSSFYRLGRRMAYGS